MDAAWIKSPTGRRLVAYWADPRPAWVWSGEGASLIWRNTAARQFYGKGRKRNFKAGAEARPIRGQIARLIRLGTLNHASLSRLQFIAGDKPVSATCTCTPIALANGEIALLVVGVDPVSLDFLEAPFSYDTASETVIPTGADYVVIEDDGQVVGGSRRAIDRFIPFIESEGLPRPQSGGDGPVVIDGAPVLLTRFKASSGDAELVLLEPTPARETAIAPQWETAEEANMPAEPVLPTGPSLELSEPDATARRADPDKIPDLELPASRDGLTSLFDRLADDGALYTPIGDEDEDTSKLSADVVESQTLHGADGTKEDAAEPGEPLPPAPDLVRDSEEIAELVASAHPETGPETEDHPLFRVSGRGFTPLYGQNEISGSEGSGAPESEPPVGKDSGLLPTADGEPDAPAADEALGGVDRQSVERASRYNFDELSRILTDRVGGDGARAEPAGVLIERDAGTPEGGTGSGALVRLGGETLVLNRLPLGILVFRDQQVLFANRAITEMIGYDSVESLRESGLAAIFPSRGGETHEAGPVNHLVQRDGTLVPVTARLQSISWQGRPALMLSASTTEVRTGHEAAVRAFAALMADTREDGFIELARSGTISVLSARGALILGKSADQVVGRPLSQIVDAGEGPALKEFLERPARFAETARPGITLKGKVPGTQVLIFAQGQAGIVTGYFGFVQLPGPAAHLLPAASAQDLDPGLLGRLSRGLRRPLNTVIGFSDLIGSAAFGQIENQRYLDYARDIKSAGHEIAALVDELDDYARLRDGRYLALPADIELVGLLESCVIRVRGQANAARVLVRSAISEKLPRIRADRASLAQAVLNLLASAISQTPKDTPIVLSAQREDNGGVIVHVRGAAAHDAELGERFVVFRDGVGRGGEVLGPVRSSVGLALTRSLLAVNACTLSVDPAGTTGTLFSLLIPPENVVQG